MTTKNLIYILLYENINSVLIRLSGFELATTINKIYTVGYLFSIHKGNFAE